MITGVKSHQLTPDRSSPCLSGLQPTTFKFGFLVLRILNPVRRSNDSGGAHPPTGIFSWEEKSVDIESILCIVNRIPLFYDKL
jgi:hypothetical protein